MTSATEAQRHRGAREWDTKRTREECQRGSRQTRAIPTGGVSFPSVLCALCVLCGFPCGYSRVSFTFSVVKNSMTSPGFTSL